MLFRSYRPATEIHRPGPATSPMVRHSSMPPAGPPGSRPVPTPTYTRRSNPPYHTAAERSGPPAALVTAGAGAGPSRPEVTSAPDSTAAATRRNSPQRKPANGPESTVTPPTRRVPDPERRAVPGTTPSSRPVVAPPTAPPHHSAQSGRSYSRSAPPPASPSSGTPSLQARPPAPPSPAPAASPASPPPRREGEGERSVGRRPAMEQNQR